MQIVFGTPCVDTVFITYILTVLSAYYVGLHTYFMNHNLRYTYFMDNHFDTWRYFVMKFVNHLPSSTLNIKGLVISILQM